jgi:hypothetical protein
LGGKPCPNYTEIIRRTQRKLDKEYFSFGINRRPKSESLARYLQFIEQERYKEPVIQRFAQDAVFKPAQLPAQPACNHALRMFSMIDSSIISKHRRDGLSPSSNMLNSRGYEATLKRLIKPVLKGMIDKMQVHMQKKYLIRGEELFLDTSPQNVF